MKEEIFYKEFPSWGWGMEIYFFIKRWLERFKHFWLLQFGLWSWKKQEYCRKGIGKLKKHCDFRKIDCILVFTPDFKLMKEYDLGGINKYIEEICTKLILFLI